MGRHNDLNVGQGGAHRRKQGPLPKRMQVSVTFVEQQNAWPPATQRFIPLREILAHHEVGNPTNRRSNTIRHLRKIQAMVAETQAWFKPWFDHYFEAYI